MNSTSTIAHQKTEQTENIESRIIEAAKQEFIKKGFEQTSMSDIAAVVGINRPTLHYYFRTKLEFHPLDQPHPLLKWRSLHSGS